MDKPAPDPRVADPVARAITLDRAMVDVLADACAAGRVFLRTDGGP